MAHRFDVLELALELIRLMRPVVERIRQIDRALAAQRKDATRSIASHISEGSRRLGKNRIHLGSIATANTNGVLYLHGIENTASGAAMNVGQRPRGPNATRGRRRLG